MRVTRVPGPIATIGPTAKQEETWESVPVCCSLPRVLTWGVNASVSSLNINTIGVILMVVGIVGFIVSLFFWSSWGGFSAAGRDTTVIRERNTVDRV
jgi:hypothetical protein